MLREAMTTLVIAVAALGTAKAQADPTFRASVTIESSTKFGGKPGHHRHLKRGHHHWSKAFDRGRADWSGTWTRERISKWHRDWLDKLDGKFVDKRDRRFGDRWDRRFGDRWDRDWAGKRDHHWAGKRDHHWAGKRIGKGAVIVRPARAFHHRFRPATPLIRHNVMRRSH